MHVQKHNIEKVSQKTIGGQGKAKVDSGFLKSIDVLERNKGSDFNQIMFNGNMRFVRFENLIVA